MGAIIQCKSAILCKETTLLHLPHPSQGIFCITLVSVILSAPKVGHSIQDPRAILKHWGSGSQGYGLMDNHQWAPMFGLGAPLLRTDSCGKKNSAVANSKNLGKTEIWFWHYWTRQTYRKRQLSQLLCAEKLFCNCEEICSSEANRGGLILTHME